MSLYLLQETAVLGLGRRIKCPNCNNISREEVVVYHLENGFFYAVPFKHSYGEPFAKCTVCNSITSNTPDGISINEILEVGKEETKKWFEEQGWLVKKRWHRHLKKNGLGWLSDYIKG